MERLSYEEARNWFWVRTLVWLVPTALVSVMAHFTYTSGLIEALSERVIVSVAGGIGSVAIAVLAAYITMQTTWMRFGWRISFVLNGPACTLIAGVFAAIACMMVMTFVKASPPDGVNHPAAYDAFLIHIDEIYQVMLFSVGAAAFWGFVLGSWFAMRRDKYFIEPIIG